MTEENNKEEKKAEGTVEAPKAEKKAPARKPRPSKKPAPKAVLNADGTPAVELEERVVAVNRVAKVVKGGRRFSFSALMVVGDKNGKVGYGLGKAKEVPDAIRKASIEATRNMVTVPIENGTIPHTILGEFDAGKILFKPASEGTGIKAAGACRSILELAGVKNVLTKSLRGSNSHNVVKATFKALRDLRSVEQIAKARGLDAKALRLK
jgi:small subunit ribosomal protein S5